MNPVGYSVGILAGGEGSRFGGQDKGWVEFRGRALIEWTLDAVRAQSDDILISANRSLDRYAALGVRLVQDQTDGPYQGPFAGMVRLLENARHPWLMCLPCDALLLPPDLASRFMAVALEQGADVVVRADAQGIHPTFCWLRTALAADARRSFDEGERAPRRWFARQHMAQLMAETPINLNTPEGLAALE
ncbi:MAG: molybdenum cofactor guanylyltransferase MobA [Panacagrimonas sp.]